MLGTGLMRNSLAVHDAEKEARRRSVATSSHEHEQGSPLLLLVHFELNINLFCFSNLLKLKYKYIHFQTTVSNQGGRRCSAPVIAVPCAKGLGITYLVI